MEWLMAFSEVVYINQEKGFYPGWKLYIDIKQANHRNKRAITSIFVTFALTEIHKQAKTDLSDTSFENQTKILG